MPSIDVMTYINNIQANPEKFQSGVDLQHQQSTKMQKKFNPSLFRSPTERKNSDNFTLDSFLNSPRDRPGFKPSNYQTHGVASPSSYKSE